MSADSNSPQRSNGLAQDPLMDALRDPAETPYAASSAAMQAANAVMLANMRARLNASAQVPLRTPMVKAAANSSFWDTPRETSEDTAPAVDPTESVVRQVEAKPQRAWPHGSVMLPAESPAAAANDTHETPPQETPSLAVTAPVRIESQEVSIAAEPVAETPAFSISPSQARIEGYGPIDDPVPDVVPHGLVEPEFAETPEEKAAYEAWNGVETPAQRAWAKPLILGMVAITLGIFGFVLLRAEPGAQPPVARKTLTPAAAGIAATVAPAPAPAAPAPAAPVTLPKLTAVPPVAVEAPAAKPAAPQPAELKPLPPEPATSAAPAPAPEPTPAITVDSRQLLRILSRP